MTGTSEEDTWMMTFRETAGQTNSLARVGPPPQLHDQKVKEKQVKKNSYMAVTIQALCHSV